MHPDWRMESDQYNEAQIEGGVRAYEESLRAQGRHEMLRDMAIGAAWSAQIYTWHYCHWVRQHDESRAWPFDLAARRAREHARLALQALADLGDQHAIDILGGER